MEMTKNNRRAQLMQAALVIFAEKGYAGTRMDEIAHAVGIAKSTVYEYFPSKEALLTACGREFLVSMTAKVRAIFAEDCTLRERLGNYVRLSLHTFTGMQGNVFRHGGSVEAMQIAHQCMEENVQEMIDIVGNALVEGQKRGEISQDCDLPVLTMLLMGLPQVVCNPIMKNDEKTLEQLLDFVYKAASK